MGCGTVLVVDADGEWRSRMAYLLARAGLATVGAASAADALALAQRERPAVVVLDVALPDVDGYELCHELRNAFGDTLPIVVVSADRNEPHDRIAALLIGADDYVAKSCDPGELIARVRRHALRTSGNAGNGRNGKPADHAADREAFGLTRRELAVLQLLAEGLTQRDIARELFISPKTVASHIQRILGKLGVHSRAHAVALAHREGLVPDFAAHSAVFASPAAAG
jgi:DNA-binding NarL/FixJ family response regulator